MRLVATQKTPQKKTKPLHNGSGFAFRDMCGAGLELSLKNNSLPSHTDKIAGK
jgi:hypothetical protein